MLVLLGFRYSNELRVSFRERDGLSGELCGVQLRRVFVEESYQARWEFDVGGFSG